MNQVVDILHLLDPLARICKLDQVDEIPSLKVV